MDRAEAKALLAEWLVAYRRKPFADLVRLVDDPDVDEVVGRSGVRYQLEAMAVWDDRRRENLRVIGMIDDGGWRAFRPLTVDFIMAPDGTFIGEDGD